MFRGLVVVDIVILTNAIAFHRIGRFPLPDYQPFIIKWKNTS
jgi:hypothetical protein